MIECIGASYSESGIIGIIPNHTPGLWEEIKECALSCEKLETLVGYGIWTSLYRVQLDDGLYRTYAVAE